MMRWAILLLLFLPSLVHGQLDVPGPLVLDGTGVAARQIIGLGYPVDSTAGVRSETARARGPITSFASGQSVLVVVLDPPIASIPAGMELTLIPSVAHNAAVQLSVNGLGPFDLVKWGGVPLDSAELPTGVPARAVFDGNRFQLLSDGGKPCVIGYTAVSNIHCIQDSSMSALNFRNAATSCSMAGGRLCSMSEWAIACHRLPGFLGSVSALEWVDHATNSQTQGKLVGIDRLTQAFGCNFGDTDDHLAIHRYRCCMNR